MKRWLYPAITLLMLLVFAAGSLSEGEKLSTIQSFRVAKAHARIIYQEHPYTFYCNCGIKWEGKKGIPRLSECGYEVRKQHKRAARVEWEHVVPAWQFGHQLKCWQDGGRQNCRKSSQEFRLMEADLHNLVPAIGEVNSDRSNFNFSEWNGLPHQYGRCPMVVDYKSRKVQPPESARGFIARAYLYMHDRYGFQLAQQQRRLLEAWARQYPPSQWECHRHSAVVAKLGWQNVHVERACRDVALEKFLRS